MRKNPKTNKATKQNFKKSTFLQCVQGCVDLRAFLLPFFRVLSRVLSSFRARTIHQHQLAARGEPDLRSGDQTDEKKNRSEIPKNVLPPKNKNQKKSTKKQIKSTKHNA